MSIRPTNQPLEERQYLSCDDAGQLLGVTVDTIRAWIGSRQLVAADVSRGRGDRPRWRIDRNDLQHFLAKRRTVAPPPATERRRVEKSGKQYV